MENETTWPFLKQLTITIITLVFGSFVFVGIIENYKSDESIKIKQLESYFKPAREAAHSCLKTQNDLYIHYPSYGGAFELFFAALENMRKKPELERSHQYGLYLEAYVKNLEQVKKTQEELPVQVRKCRAEVYLKLEALAIATGTFEFFMAESRKRDKLLNQIDKEFRTKLKENNKSMTAEDLLKMLNKFGELNMNSKNEIKKMISEFSEMLPVIKAYSLALAETEKKKYKVEAEFFSKIRIKSAEHINNRFKQGFFSWLRK